MPAHKHLTSGAPGDKLKKKGVDCMKLHVLHCGYIRVDQSAAFGNDVNLKNTARQMLTPDSRRLTLPVCCYLLEHPRGPVLVDTGLSRELSPAGVYDPKAALSLLPPQLAAFYHPWVPEGMTAAEQLEAMGIQPEDLALIILTHLDADHVMGLKSLYGAKKILLPEDEYFWSCRTVYKLRQPQSLWMGESITREFYRGSPLGPNRWAIDVYGDESLQLVNVPGHTDGQAAVVVRNGGRFVILAADAAFSPRNWREEITPGYGFDRKQQLKSLRWLADMEKDPGCVKILCSHDAGIAPHVIEL